MDDSMTIWFAQIVGREIRLINYYENSGMGIGHYIDYLFKLRDDPTFKYRYGRHYAPHDIAVRELGTGVSRWATAKKKGLKFEVVQRLEIEDKQQAARDILPLCFFDEEHCSDGVRHMEAYRKEWDDRLGRWKDHPHHDQHCHAADGFMTGAVAVGQKFGTRVAARPQPGASTGPARGLRGVV
jgi:hypothetical protein